MSGALTSSATLPALKGYGVAITKRCYRHLSAEDRETLSLGLGLIQGASLRALARVLGRAPSTLSREYARNTTRGRLYRARTAQTQAATRARQPRRSRALVDPWLWQYVQTHLAQCCSPEQIAERLQRAYPVTTCANTSRLRRSMWGSMFCPAARYGAHCWRRCVRRATRGGLGRGERIDGARSPI